MHGGRRNYSDYNRGVMALRRKGIVARMAKARMVAGVVADPSENSREGGRTDERIAESAGVSSNTLRKIEKIEAQAPAEVKALAAELGERRGRPVVGEIVQEIAQIEPGGTWTRASGQWLRLGWRI